MYKLPSWSSPATFYALIFFTVTLHTFLNGASADVFAQQRGRNRKPVLLPIASSRERKPNIVLILTDDQDVELGSLNFMPKTLRAIRDKGAEFRHAYVTTPMCCPSRSSLLTGMYVHNHNVYTNNDNCSSTLWQATHETRSFATYLSNAGYRTGYFGKYLNKYNGSYIPPGWREWGGLIMNSKYYNYSINMNGKKIKHGFDYQKDYYSDLIANDSIAFLRQSKKNSAHKPVMLTMSFPAPHGPEDSAPQYSHLFFNVTTHHTPSYDYAPNPDKQWILQVTKKMQPIHRQFTDLLMTKRLQTLQSVDAAVERVVDELEALGELHNTYIVYTSDHGYHLGQFGLIKGKSFPFEFDVRVPFLVRGPGVEPGTVVDDIVLNIDLAPTFLEMAGVEPPSHMDGHSVMPLFLNSKRKRLKWPDTFLIESSGRREYPTESKVKANKITSAHNNRWNLTTTIPPPFTQGIVVEEIPHSSTTTELFHSTFTSSPKPPLTDVESAEDSDIMDDVDFDDVDDDDDQDDDDNDDNVDDIEIDDIDDEEELDDDNEHLIGDNEEEQTIEDMLKGSQTQLDNQLLPQVPEMPINKLERLAIECLQEEYQLPCRQGQKWYCQHEYGRWRKHKCKLQIPIPHTKKSYRKCACFTPEGLVYRRIPINSTVLKKPFRISRIKRHASHVRKNLRNLLGGRKISERQKRDTLTHVDSVMENIRDRIDGLQPKPHPPPLNEFNNPYANSESSTNQYNNEYCHCESEEPYKPSEKELAREAKRKLKEERLRKKERKQRKKAKLEKECLSEKMNCFSHDNDHWRTAPLWTAGPFCFCMNANNNTYSCVRTINSTHNFLYCEFTTGLITYYNLRIDPFELQNRIHQLKPDERLFLHDQLEKLKACKGRACITGSNVSSKSKSNVLPLHSIASQPQNQRYHKRRKFLDEYGNGDGGVGKHGQMFGDQINRNAKYGEHNNSNNNNNRPPMELLPKNGTSRRHSFTIREFRN